MRRALLLLFIIFSGTVLCITSCVHQPHVVPQDGDYPPAVAAIILNKCAISGCHNAASYTNANNLLMDTWDHLFNGGNSGAEVVPYCATYSPLLYFVNTDSTRGVVATPNMPLSTTTKPQTSLSAAEYQTLKDWIGAGAPDKNGNIPFATNPDTRQKIYLTQSGCNLVAVIDARRRVVMRYIPVGTYPGNESLHDVEMSGDGMYAYVSFYNGNYFQKIDTRTDTVVATLDIGSNAATGGAGTGWSIITLSTDNSSLMVSAYMSSGEVKNVATANMQINQDLSIDPVYGGTDLFPYPHGIAGNATFDTFFATLQLGNTINKYSFNGGFWYKRVSIDGLPSITTDPVGVVEPDPHQVEMAPDYSHYFVTCQTSNEVRVMDAYSDTLIKVIPVGTKPQEMATATSKNYLFVACMEDAANPNPGNRGSVYVIDMNTFSIVKIIYGDFYQPHDLCVDEQDGLVYIASTNSNPSGPAPHHVTACGGRPGWYSVYDLNTLKPADTRRYEVTVFPYAISPRF